MNTDSEPTIEPGAMAPFTPKKTSHKHNKWTSLTLWFTVWSVVMISYIVFAGKTDFISLALALAAMPVAYAAKSTITKKIYHDQGEQ